MKSSVAFLMCVLAGSSVVSGLKCYDYTCPTASTLTAPASSAADCVAASAAVGNGGGACVYTAAVTAVTETCCIDAACTTDANCDGVTNDQNAATCTSVTPSGAVAATCLDSSGAVDTTCTAANADQATCVAANGADSNACVWTAASKQNCLYTAPVTGVTEDCTTSGGGADTNCDGVTNDGNAATCTSVMSTGTAAVTATTDTCTPCKNTCATGQECFNQEGTSAGNNGGCVAAGGESGAISGGGSQSICTTDLCNDNTGTSPAFRAEFLSALVVAIFASLY